MTVFTSIQNHSDRHSTTCSLLSLLACALQVRHLSAKFHDGNCRRTACSRSTLTVSVHPAPRDQTQHHFTVSAAGVQMVHYTALGRNADVVADVQVLRDPDLAANVHVVAERCAPSDTRLSRNDAALPKLNVVADLDLINPNALSDSLALCRLAESCRYQVIELASSADHGVPPAPPIDRAVRSAIHIRQRISTSSI